MGETSSAIIVALIAAIFSCYFAASTVALRTFSRTRLAELLEERGREDQYDRFINEWPRILLTASMIRVAANLVALLATLHAVTGMLPGHYPIVQYAVAFGAAGLLISVFGVAIPSSWGRYRTEHLLVTSLPILRVGMLVAYPFIRVLGAFDPIVRRISGTDEQDDGDSPLTDEILSVVEEHEHEHEVRFDEDQKDMLEAVLSLSTTTAAQIMTPRTDITGIEVSNSLAQILQIIRDEGHSRIPVYEDDLDHLLGILYVKDLVQFLGASEKLNIRSVLREPFMVPESKQVSKLLAEFKAQKIHIAIVLDEYGGTAGLVTIEDILEEIVGDIEDEYEPDEERPTITRTHDHSADVDARVRVDDLNDELDLELPEDEDYETVGGFVVYKLGRIPEAGESFDYDGMRLTVLDAEKTKVKLVRIEQLEPEPSNTLAFNSNGKNGTPEGK